MDAQIISGHRHRKHSDYRAAAAEQLRQIKLMASGFVRDDIEWLKDIVVKGHNSYIGQARIGQFEN